jgi:hypothetical protein
MPPIPSDPPEPGTSLHEEVPPPVGTLFALVLYIIVLTGMWASVYWIMLQRS